jgi:hypothetical protein
LLPFIGASVGIGGSEFDVGGSTSSSTSQTAEVVVGATRLMSRQIGLTGEAFYRTQKLESENSVAPGATNETRMNGTGVRFGFTAFLF